MGLGRPQVDAKFEVAGFIYYENIREFVFKRQNRFFEPPFVKELVVTYRLHLQLVGKRVDFLFAIIELLR